MEETFKKDYYKEFILKNIEKISDNNNLSSAICKILTYSEIIKSDNKYLFLASLISSDNIIDKESVNYSLSILNFIKTYINLFGLSEKDNEEVLKYVNEGIQICKEELKIFK